MLIWYFSNNLDIYDYVGKLPKQHFSVQLFSNPGDKLLFLLKFYGARISEWNITIWAFINNCHCTTNKKYFPLIFFVLFGFLPPSLPIKNINVYIFVFVFPTHPTNTLPPPQKKEEEQKEEQKKLQFYFYSFVIGASIFTLLQIQWCPNGGIFLVINSLKLCWLSPTWLE